ncbi:MAG: DUF4445 domain-containing protein [Clostridia bacterium]|nr:DUF4445 domain-containing protein [Clostridia bacterium]
MAEQKTAAVTVNGETKTAAIGSRLSDLLDLFLPCGGLGKCGKCVVLVNGKKERACRYRILSDCTVETPEPDGEILSVSGAEESGCAAGRLALALDVGTTTLALALVSLDEGRIARVLTAANPQAAFGADVMSRIGYCAAHGPQKLQSVLVEEINRLIETMEIPEVPTLYAAGNMTMLHLFLGEDCSSLGAAPYTPVFLKTRRAEAQILGLSGVREVVTLPGISAFVGADLVAGLNLIGMPREGMHRLLVDLGTNAEIVLFSRDSALCTAAAAGPCFEGANISCGMSATSGAISAFSFDEEGGRHIRTVNNAPAKGLCGTGLIDVIAALLDRGAIDESGLLSPSPYPLADGIFLTGRDVRQFQLAKSAVCSAVLTLMERKGVSFDEIDSLCLSGGFSAFINVKNAVRTGLLPAELGDRCRAVNNSSLLGTAAYACRQNDLSAYTAHAGYLDLSPDPLFAELFVDNLLFPETR